MANHNERLQDRKEKQQSSKQRKEGRNGKNCDSKERL